METVKFNVPSINCNHCVHTIQSELSEMEGVVSVVANSSTKEVDVQFQSPATALKIEELLAEINYPVKK